MPDGHRTLKCEKCDRPLQLVDDAGHKAVGAPRPWGCPPCNRAEAVEVNAAKAKHCAQFEEEERRANRWANPIAVLLIIAAALWFLNGLAGSPASCPDAFVGTQGVECF